MALLSTLGLKPTVEVAKAIAQNELKVAEARLAAAVEPRSY